MRITRLLAFLFLAWTVAAQQGAVFQSGAVAQGGQTVVSTGSQAAPAALQITTICPLADGQVGTAYSQTFNATGGTLPYTWTVASGTLPTSTTLSTSGQISGTPTVAGTYIFSVQVADGATPQQTATQSCQILISSAPPPPLQITTTSLPSGNVTLPYSQNVNASGGVPPYLFTIISGAVPSGLALASNGNIGGTPTAQQNAAFTVQATDSVAAAATKALNIVINAAPPLTAGDPTLPQLWVDPHECDTALTSADVTRTIKTSGGNYACTYAGFNQAMSDWVAAPDQWWKIVVEHGCTVNNGSVIWQPKVGATKCIVYLSDTPLTAGQTVCSHGIQDPHELVSTTLDPGYRNLGCDGSNLQYGTGAVTYTNVGANAAYNDVAKMYTLYFSITGGNATPAIKCSGWGSDNIGCNHIAMFDGHVAADPGGSAHRLAFNNQAVLMDAGPTTPTLPSQYSNHVHLNRFYMQSDLGDVISFTGGTYSGMGNFLNMWCYFCSIENSYFDQIGNNDGAESHVITWGNAPGPVKVNHNWIEGSSINIMSGGSQPQVLGLVPSDIEQRRNRLTKPVTWMPPSVCTVGSGLAIKSNQEFKVAKRALVDGNIHEYSCAGAQDGQNYTLTVRDACNGGTSPCDTNYSAIIQDVTWSNEIFRHAENGVQMDARSGGTGNGAGVSLAGLRWKFINQLGYDIGDSARFVSHSPNYAMREAAAGNSWSSCLLTRGTVPTGFGVQTASGDCTASPQNTTGARQLSMNVGDPVTVSSCVSGGSNPDATPASFQTGGATEGNKLLSTVTTGLTFSYANTGTALKTALCTVVNNQGYPADYKAQHITFVGSNSSMRFPSVSILNGTNLPFPMRNTITDNIYASTPATGLLNAPSNREGTASEADWELSTFSFHHVVMAGRTASLYTEYGGAFNGATPPTTIYFPANIPCATANATTEGTCIGFTGMMSGAAFNMNPTDYHAFVLHSTSPFTASGTKKASDNLQMGANIGQIDAAQTLQQYVCSTNCTNNGTNHGPYPD